MDRPPPEERPTAEELANASRGGDASGVTCPKCGRKMMAEKTMRFDRFIRRYRACFCGHKVITRQGREEIVRDVIQHDISCEDSRPGILPLNLGRVTA